MKKVKIATALKYDSNYDAPIVTAAGIGLIADNIIEKAKENDVPVIQDEELSQLLASIDVGDSIPEELYEVVAKVIAYVMDVDNTLSKR